MNTRPIRCILVLLIVIGMAMPSSGAGDASLSVKRVVGGNTAFAFDLYSILKNKEGNLFFSPYSISTAIAMTYGGARANTAVEMQKAMHFALDTREIHPALAQLRGQLDDVQKRGAVQLAIANSVWPQKRYPILPEYVSLMKKNHDIEMVPLDYEGATEQSRLMINKWVESRTRGKIADIIAPRALDPQTRLALVNAVYFNGKWKSQFGIGRTAEDEFYVSPRSTVKVRMMEQQNAFGYAAIDGLEIVELPYLGNELSMLVILPSEKDALPKIEKRLTWENFSLWKRLLARQQVVVSLPKFTITGGTYELSGALKKLGMVDAFSRLNADFSGMDGRRNWLYIGVVLHKAFVDVNEEGTEAAAATVVMTPPGGMSSGSGGPVTFTADHPFLFVIQERRTGSILFIGRLTDPTKSN